MTKTVQALETLKRIRGLPSDYAAAKALGRTTSAISKWRSGTQMDVESAVKVAELSGQDPSVLVAEIGAEQAKTENEKRIFNELSDARKLQLSLKLIPEIKKMLTEDPSIIDRAAQTIENKEERAIFVSTMRKLCILCKIEALPYRQCMARPLLTLHKP